MSTSAYAATRTHVARQGDPKTVTLSSATSSGKPVEETASNAGDGYSFSSSTIVRVAIAAGIIVIVICALLMFFKISGWIRYRQRLRRQHILTAQLVNEEKARAFELAAWADHPGQAPVEHATTPVSKWWRGLRKKEDEKVHRRGRTNAYAVYEWEGVPQ